MAEKTIADKILEFLKVSKSRKTIKEICIELGVKNFKKVNKDGKIVNNSEYDTIRVEIYRLLKATPKKITQDGKTGKQYLYSLN